MHFLTTSNFLDLGALRGSSLVDAKNPARSSSRADRRASGRLTSPLARSSSLADRRAGGRSACLLARVVLTSRPTSERTVRLSARSRVLTSRPTSERTVRLSARSLVLTSRATSERTVCLSARPHEPTDERTDGSLWSPREPLKKRNFEIVENVAAATAAATFFDDFKTLRF